MKLEICSLEKTFKDKVILKNLNYTMETGVYGLLGVNGVGKTTFMRILCTLIKPDSGSIKLNGRDIYELNEDYRKIIGYLPQEFGFYPELTVQQYMMYISSIKGLPHKIAKSRTKNLLEIVGLYKNKDMRMKKLSGGMKRRVGIAQALLNNPKILILDEPTVGLDPNERIRFRSLISEISKDRLVLLSTHIVSDISYIADTIILMNKGEFVFSGSIDEVIKSMDKDVYICNVEKKDLDYYVKHYCISNTKITSSGVEVRILAKDRPNLKAKKIDATLEDAFLCYFGKEGEIKNDFTI